MRAFSPGTDSLAVYKKRIHDALFPEWNKPARVAEATKVLVEYRKAIDEPGGLLELHVFWCETASGFVMEFGYADESYFDALLRQFEAALSALGSVSEAVRQSAIFRLTGIRDRTEVGYGVQDDMGCYWNAPV